MSDRAYIVAPRRADGKAPALAKAYGPGLGDLLLCLDRAVAEDIAADLNDYGEGVWAVYPVTVTVENED